MARTHLFMKPTGSYAQFESINILLALLTFPPPGQGAEGCYDRFSRAGGGGEGHSYIMGEGL